MRAARLFNFVRNPFEDEDYGLDGYHIQRPPRVVMADLPVEILCDVFLYTVAAAISSASRRYPANSARSTNAAERAQDVQRRALLSVSQHWRKTAFALPQLWHDLHFVAGSTRLSTVRTRLFRTKATPLDVSLVGPETYESLVTGTDGAAAGANDETATSPVTPMTGVAPTLTTPGGGFAFFGSAFHLPRYLASPSSAGGVQHNHYDEAYTEYFGNYMASSSSVEAAGSKGVVKREQDLEVLNDYFYDATLAEEEGDDDGSMHLQRQLQQLQQQQLLVDSPSWTMAAPTPTASMLPTPAITPGGSGTATPVAGLVGSNGTGSTDCHLTRTKWSYERMIRLLRPHSKRIRTLKASLGAAETASRLLPLRGPHPTLEHLAVDIEGELSPDFALFEPEPTPPEQQLETEEQGEKTELKTLDFSADWVPETLLDNVEPRRLRSLRVVVGSSLGHDLPQYLARAPELQVARISDCAPQEHDRLPDELSSVALASSNSTTTQPIILLPKLRLLEIPGHHLLPTLAQWKLPTLEHLTILSQLHDVNQAFPALPQQQESAHAIPAGEQGRGSHYRVCMPKLRTLTVTTSGNATIREIALWSAPLPPCAPTPPRAPESL